MPSSSMCFSLLSRKASFGDITSILFVRSATFFIVWYLVISFHANPTMASPFVWDTRSRQRSSTLLSLSGVSLFILVPSIIKPSGVTSFNELLKFSVR